VINLNPCDDLFYFKFSSSQSKEKESSEMITIFMQTQAKSNIRQPPSNKTHLPRENVFIQI
jgi:hypothetical protein